MSRRKALIYGMPLLAIAYVVALLGLAQPGGAFITIARWIGNSSEWASGFTAGVASPPFPATTLANVQTAGARWSNPSTGKNFTFFDYTNLAGPTRIWVDKRSFAAQGWPGDPGITFITRFTTGANAGRLQFANVYLNSDWTWNTTCTLNQAGKQADVLTIILHEMGHAVSLDHDPAFPNAVMWPNYVCKQNLTADDKNGIAALYP
ncbi:MAG TPA: matrixin family metalloprotease [Thermoanaerobaculia bacterium]|nr:matrixin family metalloprotease [Thermoanaerobaculia bacterium]